MKTVLVFGTFDGMHQGHLFFLSEAAKLGDRLVVSVARDEHVRTLKNKSALHNEKERIELVLAQDEVDEAILSDEELGSFELVSSVDPAIIAFGHDQVELENTLVEWLEGRQMREIEVIKIAHN